MEDRMVDITKAEKNKEERMKINEGSLRDLWDNLNSFNIQITGVSEEEEKESV